MTPTYVADADEGQTRDETGTSSGEDERGCMIRHIITVLNCSETLPNKTTLAGGRRVSPRRLVPQRKYRCLSGTPTTGRVFYSVRFPYVDALRPELMSQEVTYELATARWRRTDTVQIISTLGTEIADFPLTFLASCGDNTWRYVLDTVHLLVEPVPDRQGSIYVGSEEMDGQEEVPVATEDPPQAGIYRYKQLGELSMFGSISPSRYHLPSFINLGDLLSGLAGTLSEPTFVRGPEYYSRFKSPTLLPGESSASASSQATGRPEQVCRSQLTTFVLSLHAKLM